MAECIFVMQLEEFSMFGTKKSAGLLILIVAALVLAACGPAATPTADPAEIRTQVAGTVQAGLTQTAAAKPTSTATNTPEPTSTPTLTTPTSNVTRTAAVTATVTSQAAPDLAEVIGVSAFATFTPGQDFSVTWTVKNTGNNTWTANYLVRCYTTAYCFGGQTISFGKDVKPGETIDLTINLKAPSTTGDHNTLWVLTNASGTNFGRGLSYNFKVAGSTAPTTAPTAEPTIAPTP
jgi:hypothetical protein